MIVFELSETFMDGSDASWPLGNAMGYQNFSLSFTRTQIVFYSNFPLNQEIVKILLKYKVLNVYAKQGRVEDSKFYSNMFVLFFSS